MSKFKIALFSLAATVSLCAILFPSSVAQEQVRVNIQFGNNTADMRNLDAFVAREGCPINAALSPAQQVAQKRDCREAAVLRFLSETEKGYDASAAAEAAAATARNQVDTRWVPGVTKPTPTPAPTPTPVIR